ncbi:hypothetical protein GHT09_000622 [Marmota monax]|uniref:Uncharacterized protein n=1 Tax=Marmota monax TaxID=9995 RepID=A0A834V979_MARMO|nr:hypothetical protein GHT09_000622 [Marmota monax]
MSIGLWLQIECFPPGTSEASAGDPLGGCSQSAGSGVQLLPCLPAAFDRSWRLGSSRILGTLAQPPFGALALSCALNEAPSSPASPTLHCGKYPALSWPLAPALQPPLIPVWKLDPYGACPSAQPEQEGRVRPVPFHLCLAPRWYHCKPQQITSLSTLL